MITATARLRATTDARTHAGRLQFAKDKIESCMDRADKRGSKEASCQIPKGCVGEVNQYLKSYGYNTYIFLKNNNSIIKVSWKDPNLAGWEK